MEGDEDGCFLSDALVLVALKLLFQFGNFVASEVLLLGGLQRLYEIHDVERKWLHKLRSLVALIRRIVRVERASCPVDVDLPASQCFENGCQQDRLGYRLSHYWCAVSPV